MEYTNIISLVPEGEHFDPTAMNEGVWITEGHMNAIENHFTTVTSAGTALQETINGSAQEIQSLKDQLNASKQVITERDATIMQLNEQIATLKAGPADKEKTTQKEEDDLNDHGAEALSEISSYAAKLRAIRDGK